MLPERSTLLVPEFPRPLRLRIKALANLRDQRMHEVIEDLLEEALAGVDEMPARQDQRAGRRDEGTIQRLTGPAQQKRRMP